MAQRQGMAQKRVKADGAGWVRASISFPSDLYGALEKISKAKKVSLAWVVRDAVEGYVKKQGTLTQ